LNYLSLYENGSVAEKPSNGFRIFTLQSNHGKKRLAGSVSGVNELGEKVDVVAAVKAGRTKDRADEILVPELGRDHDRIVAGFIVCKNVNIIIVTDKQ